MCRFGCIIASLVERDIPPTVSAASVPLGERLTLRYVVDCGDDRLRLGGWIAKPVAGNALRFDDDHLAPKRSEFHGEPLGKALVIYENVDATEAFDRLANHAPDLVAPADIELLDERLRWVLLDEVP